MSYWVRSGQLLAGGHPGSLHKVKARLTLSQLIEAGVSVFLDLTEAGEYYAYERDAQWEATNLGRLIACYRLPIEDNKVPTPAMMIEILDTIDTVLEAKRSMYLHCLHGTGRTGTVVGCYLVLHGLDGETALKENVRLRQGTPDEKVISPRHQVQRDMVLNWEIGK